ncbi:hypothetical protein JL722_8585 [Aureococcus anophagefferens]|nr:hypothetical protein JL722_8585 [Aureococcus anophagefferens]
MASDDAKEKMRLRVFTRNLRQVHPLLRHQPFTSDATTTTTNTDNAVDGAAAAPTRRWELAELEPASPPPAKRARPEPAPAPAPAADEPELLFSPPFKFATTAGSYETLARYPFKSHDPEFDYLKSLEVEEKINQIRFCRGLGRRSCRLLSANDKTIKLWKVHERRVDGVGDLNGPGFRGRGGRLRVPRVVPRGRAMAATPARCYANAHAYHINSVSVNSDGEHFASADDLRINLWNLEVDDAFNVVDLKPANMEDLTEVITSAAFHPVDCAVLLYASSKGTMKLFDLAAARGATGTASRSTTARPTTRRPSPSSPRSSGTAGPTAPLKTILVHEHLRPRSATSTSDCIFDKFEVAAGRDADAVVTGSYGDAAHVFDGAGRSVEIDLDLAARTRRRRGALR